MENNGEVSEEHDVDKFKNEILRIIDYFADEYNLSYAEMIGVLDILKNHLYHDMIDEDDDE